MQGEKPEAPQISASSSVGSLDSRKPENRTLWIAKRVSKLQSATRLSAVMLQVQDHLKGPKLTEFRFTVLSLPEKIGPNKS